MFCRQCEQTVNSKACTKVGVCGKDPIVSSLQHLLIYTLCGLAPYAKASLLKGELKEGDIKYILEALFSTLTNVNFDPEALKRYILTIHRLSEDLKSKGLSVNENEARDLKLEDNISELIKKGDEAERRLFFNTPNEDIQSLKEITLYSVKGIAAYAYHALILGRSDKTVYEFIFDALDQILRDSDLSFWMEMVFKAGEINFKTMELLDNAHTELYGHPIPTKVPLGVKKGKAILVSGHDLKDLEHLLIQTDGKGIYVYTHGEMLPAHGYPKLKKYRHLYGHYGTAWQNQRREFLAFPGPILMTTNCLIKPEDAYMDRIFTKGPVGWPGVNHIKGYDFSLIIDKALKLNGFEEDREGGEIMVGFARNAILSVSDKLIDLIKTGKIRRFILVGGCDGARPGRSYYADFVEKTPNDTVILTLACGKFRFFDKKLGTIDGIPRLIDIGQCNDAYSAIQIAVALSKAFNLEVNDLPLSLVLSWFEQKAVAILTTLLYLGIKNIRLGPTLPAFISPNVLKILIEKFNIKLIGNPDEDLKEILQ
ncbi:MAG: hydroxylamine reductase [Deltaproteobacteria bacterium]|nr:hydroxylamine reductase [Deltaproteobacteria bacterium]